MIVFLRVRCGMSRAEVLRTSLPEYRCIRAEMQHADGFSDICQTLMEIVKGFGKKKAAPRNRQEALTERFGAIELPPVL